jgi:hypothetical protein
MAQEWMQEIFLRYEDAIERVETAQWRVVLGVMRNQA